jgi:hypothetical protein
MCRFALEEYREWANRLAHPLLRPLARRAFSLLSRQRSRISRWLSLVSEVEIAQTLSQVSEPPCPLTPSPAAAVAERGPSGPTGPPEDNHQVVFTLDEPTPGGP